ncbi:hypothetical protein ACXHXM_27325|uniref:c-type cytochrome n=1 Tax=Rhizobium altiplani TaxID=1864509 RepID=UPI000B1CB74F
MANRCLDCVKVLVEAGADVNAIWVRGDPARLPAIITPYHLARRDNHPEIAAYLLAHGVIIQKPEPISAKLANGDPTKGAAFFVSNCATCHATKAQSGATRWPEPLEGCRARQGIGEFQPLLPDPVGVGGDLDVRGPHIFLTGPTLTTPGVNMEIRGAPDETDRLNVIAYLRTLGDAPVPLP